MPVDAKFSRLIKYFPKIFISVILIAGLVVGVYLTVNQSENKDIRTKATAEKKLNLIISLEQDPQTKQVSIVKAVVNDGYWTTLPKRYPDSFRFTHRLEATDPDGRVTYSLPLNLTDEFPFEGGVNPDGTWKGGIHKLDKPRATVSLPFTVGRLLRLRDLKNGQAPIQNLNMEKVVLAAANPQKITPDPSKIINITPKPEKDKVLGTFTLEPPPEITSHVFLENNGYCPSQSRLTYTPTLYADDYHVETCLDPDGLDGIMTCTDFSPVGTSSSLSFINEHPQLTVDVLYRVRAHKHTEDEGTFSDYSRDYGALHYARGWECIRAPSPSPSPRPSPIPTPTPLPNDPTKFDLLFLSSNYGDYLVTDEDIANFGTDVNRITNYLIAHEPYSNHPDKLNFRAFFTATNMGCQLKEEGGGQRGRAIVCDGSDVLSEASYFGYDKIIVLYDTDIWSGSSSGSYATAYGDDKGVVTYHELGHLLGYLYDEYDYDEFTVSPSNGPNCDDVVNCTKWASIPGTGCFPVCSYSNWYRPTESDSIMKTTVIDHFDPFVGRPVMEAALVGYLEGEGGGGGEGGWAPPGDPHGCGCGMSCAAGATCAFDTGLGCDPGFDCAPGGATGFQCYNAQACLPGQDNCPKNLSAASGGNGDLNISWSPVAGWNLRHRLTVTDTTASVPIYESILNGPCVDDSGENTNMDEYDCDGQYACPVPNRASPAPGGAQCVPNQGEKGLPVNAASWTIPSTWLTLGHNYRVSLDGGDGPEGILPNCAPLETNVTAVNLCPARISCSTTYPGYEYDFTPQDSPACSFAPPYPNWPADYTCKPDVCTGTCPVLTGCSDRNTHYTYKYSFTPDNYPGCVVGTAVCGGDSWPVWAGEDAPGCANTNGDDYTRTADCNAVCPTPTPIAPACKGNRAVCAANSDCCSNKCDLTRTPPRCVP